MLLVASVFVCILFWPLVSSFGSTFPGDIGSDSSGTVNWFWRLQEEGYHLFGTTTHMISGAPIGWEEANGLNLQWLLFYYPAYLAAGVVGEVAAFNLVVVTGFVLSGAAMYLLTRYLGCNRFVAAWAGLVFIVFPWHLERAEHAGFLHLEVLVLLVLALVAAAERPSWWRASLVGLATLSCWLAVGYFGVMAAVSAGVFALAAAVVPGGRRLRMVVAPHRRRVCRDHVDGHRRGVGRRRLRRWAESRGWETFRSSGSGRPSWSFLQEAASSSATRSRPSTPRGGRRRSRTRITWAC